MTRTARVSTIKGLRRAVADPTINRVVLKKGTYQVDEPVRSAPLVIDGQGSTLVAASPAPGVFDASAILRADLEEQWHYNHDEHCGGWDNVDESKCYWPRPVSLGGPQDVYRAYTDATLAALAPEGTEPHE